MMVGEKKDKGFKLISWKALYFQKLKQQRQEAIFKLFAAVGIPVLSIWSIHNFMHHHLIDGVFDAAVALFLIGAYISFKHIDKAEHIYHACVLSLGALFMYFVYDGGHYGGKLLWTYLFPLIAFFMTGRLCGFLYSTLVLFIVLFCFYAPQSSWFTPHIYKGEIQVRFIATYSIVSVLTFIFEYVRHYFQTEMEKEKTLILEKQEELAQANAEIRVLSLNDHLTGCYNRMYLTKYLPKEIKRSKRYSKPISIIMGDVDYFKKVNDTYGHQAGDSVLKAVAMTLKSHVRKDIDWVARYGGEEFLIVLPETNPERALIVAERLLQAVSSQPVTIENNTIRVTASFGVTGVKDDALGTLLDSEAFINMADRLLYSAKTQGRNRVVSGPLTL